MFEKKPYSLQKDLMIRNWSVFAFYIMALGLATYCINSYHILGVFFVFLTLMIYTGLMLIIKILLELVKVVKESNENKSRGKKKWPSQTH